MSNPESTTDYPAFTTKSLALIELNASLNSYALLQSCMFRLANTDWDALADKSTLYSPTGGYTAAQA